MEQQDIRAFVSSEETRNSRIAPFTQTQAGTALTTLATVATQRAMLVKRLIACNTTGSAVTLTFHAIPSGGSASAANEELNGYSVGANATVDLSELVGGLYQSGTVLQVSCSTNNAITVAGYYEDIF